MSSSKAVSIFGLVVAVAAVFIDPSTQAALAAVFGAAAAAKIAAIGALIAALGKGLVEKKAE